MDKAVESLYVVDYKMIGFFSAKLRIKRTTILLRRRGK